VLLDKGISRGRSSKWAGICRYTVSECLFICEFHTGTYQQIPFCILLTVYPFSPFKKYAGASKFSFRALVTEKFLNVESGWKWLSVL
jgi:hypothetical protein